MSNKAKPIKIKNATKRKMVVQGVTIKPGKTGTIKEPRAGALAIAAALKAKEEAAKRAA